jgi:hypothetical protein
MRIAHVAVDAAFHRLLGGDERVVRDVQPHTTQHRRRPQPFHTAV